MDLQIATWKIRGIKPLLQSSSESMLEPKPEPEEGESSRTARKSSVNLPKSEVYATAEKQLYQNGDATFYHPAIAFQEVLQEACYGRKLGRANALDIVVHSISPVDEHFLLLDPDTLDKKKPKPLTAKQWVPDSRRGINHNKNTNRGGVAVQCCRPKWIKWGGLLRLWVDMEFFKTLDGITDLLNVGGHITGIGVGRRRVKAIESTRRVYGSMGTGRFEATLVS